MVLIQGKFGIRKEARGFSQHRRCDQGPHGVFEILEDQEGLLKAFGADDDSVVLKQDGVASGREFLGDAIPEKPAARQRVFRDGDPAAERGKAGKDVHRGEGAVDAESVERRRMRVEYCLQVGTRLQDGKMKGKFA